MNSLNLEVITSVCDWLQQGDFVFFVTVLNTWGASPRPVGSLYAYNPQKKLQFGSLSGGCIEDDLVIKLNTTYAAGSDKPYFVTRYGDNEGDGERYLLPCGGVIELLVESLHGPEAFKHFVMLKANLIAHRRVARYLDFTLSLPYLLSSDDQASNSKPESVT